MTNSADLQREVSNQQQKVEDAQDRLQQEQHELANLQQRYSDALEQEQREAQSNSGNINPLI